MEVGRREQHDTSAGETVLRDDARHEQTPIVLFAVGAEAVLVLQQINLDTLKGEVGVRSSQCGHQRILHRPQNSGKSIHRVVQEHHRQEHAENRVDRQTQISDV